MRTLQAPDSDPKQAAVKEDSAVTVIRNLGVNYVDVLLCKRSDDSLFIIKEGFVDYEFEAEIRAYKLLATHGITPRLLGCWANKATDQYGMELEYIPSLDRTFQPGHPGHLRSYMKGLLKLGLVHRDIKRANVLVWHTPKDDEVHVKLIDFQVSCLLSGHIEDERMGSRGYRAPEAGRAMRMSATQEDIQFAVKGGRCDVYAAGVILLEFLLHQQLDGEQSTSLRVTEKLAVIMANRKSRQETRAQLLKTEFGYRDCTTRGRSQLRESLERLDPDFDGLHLAYQLTNHNCDERLSASQALQHPYLCPFVKEE